MNHNKPQAVLPLDMTEDTIAGMSPGTSAWTVPWAMHVDEDMKCWLAASYTVHDEPDGTVEMLVTRESDGSYSVGAPMSHKYSPGSSHYVGSPDMLPVSRLTVVDSPAGAGKSVKRVVVRIGTVSLAASVCSLGAIVQS